MAPSSISSHNQSDPLLPPKFVNEQQVEPLSRISSGAIKTLSVARIGLGAASLIAPRWTCALFKYSVPADAAVVVRLFGIRDFMLGELLYTAEDKTRADGGRREMKRALWANIGSDTVDVCSVAFAVASGSLGKLPGALLAGGALVGVVLGALGLSEL